MASKTARANAARSVKNRKKKPARFGKIDRKEGKRGVRPGEAKKLVRGEKRNARRRNIRAQRKLFPAVPTQALGGSGDG